MADKDKRFQWKIVISEETWYFLYDPETKDQSSEWKTKTSLRKKKLRLNKSREKVMLEVLFDYESVIQYEFIPEDQTVNKELYLEIRK